VVVGARGAGADGRAPHDADHADHAGHTSRRRSVTRRQLLAAGVLALGAAGGEVPALDPANAARTRRIVLDADATGPTVDGRAFDHHRTDATAELGTLEVWEIVNAHTVDHPFHLHSYRVQLLDRDGRPPPHRAWLDTVTVPGGSTVRLAVPFTGSPGRTVYHCHVAAHEDLGMMAVLEVRPRPA
jgi:FtsP/CotA-like multicopper oxidase with cupredoxin domain